MDFIIILTKSAEAYHYIFYSFIALIVNLLLISSQRRMLLITHLSRRHGTADHLNIMS